MNLGNINLLRAFSETKRAYFTQMRPEEATHCHQKHHTEYYNDGDHRTTKDTLCISYWLFRTRGRCRNAFSLAAELFEAARRTTVLVSGTRLIARSSTVTAATVEVIPEAISIRFTLSAFGHLQKSQEYNNC
ncbi:hypothetical protein OS493_010930 [Desmophyllum pertusum]|uniref:Uncharacterized protein n=1 Tax=Desmophyllum pertusum TaxID=174260 RepID=A0A9X0CYI1_9CNID|nr:hypothetical protein OS493_010930 [Desmophyllum pertusum]